MGLLSEEYAKDLRAAVFDLNHRACQEVLFGMIEELKKRPSVRRERFIELVLDGKSYSRVVKEVAHEVGVSGKRSEANQEGLRAGDSGDHFHISSNPRGSANRV